MAGRRRYKRSESLPANEAVKGPQDLGEGSRGPHQCVTLIRTEQSKCKGSLEKREGTERRRLAKVIRRERCFILGVEVTGRRGTCDTRGI